MSEAQNTEDHTPLSELSDHELIDLVQTNPDSTAVEQKLADRLEDYYELIEEVDSILSNIESFYSDTKSARHKLAELIENM